MDNEDVMNVPQGEDTSVLSNQQMLIDALEAAQNESEEEPVLVPGEPTPVAENTETMPTQEYAESAPAPQPQFTRDDIISAVQQAMENQRQQEAPVEESTSVPDEETLPDFNSEEFMDKFYDNPAEAVKNAADIIAEKKVKEVVSGIEKKLQPLLTQSENAKYKDEVRTTINDFLNNTQDAKDYFSDMTNYIKSNNLDPKNAQTYLDAYRVSKLNRLGAENEQLKANQGKGLGDYLSDENSLSEIARNELVRQRVIDEYLQGLNNGEKPRTIGGGGTNTPSAQPVNRASNMREAKAMLINELMK